MLELPYVAGYFDGEGTVGVHKQTMGRDLPRYTVNISITNTYLPILQTLKEQFGGNLRRVSPSTSSFSKRPTYVWYINGDAAQNFLRLILPYLQEKKSQAELAIQFKKRPPRGRYSLPPKPHVLEAIKKQEEIDKELKRLKRIEY